MPVTMTGTALAPAVAANPGHLSKTRDNTIKLSIRGLTQAQMAAYSYGYGGSAGAPATYAGLTHAQNGAINDGTQFNSLLIKSAVGADVTSVDAEVTLVPDPAFAPGDHFWFCIFAVNPPIAGSVPVASIGPFTIAS